MEPIFSVGMLNIVEQGDAERHQKLDLNIGSYWPWSLCLSLLFSSSVKWENRAVLGIWVHEEILHFERNSSHSIAVLAFSPRSSVKMKDGKEVTLGFGGQFSGWKNLC